MNAPAMTAELGARVQDYIEVEQSEADGCTCEQGLQATCDRRSAEAMSLRDEISSLKQAEREAWTLAEQVLQAVTLEEAKRVASIYLGLTTPF